MPQPAADAAYTTIVRAAQRLLTDDTKDSFGLADAVLAYVPAGSGEQGRRTDLSPREGGEVRSVPEQLKALAALLTDDGVHTPKGGNYTLKGLTHLRETSMAWPPSKRYAEAAYRTHQEAGSPMTDGGKVLAALIGIARGENKRMPTLDDEPLDPEKWNKAVYRVQTRRKGFGVAANDLRTALGRRTNNPGRNITKDELQDQLDSGEIDPEDVADVLPTDTLVGEVMDRTDEAWDRTHSESAEGLTDAEIAEADALVDQLGSAINALHDVSENLGEGYAFLLDLVKAEGCLLAVLRNIKRGRAGADDKVTILDRTERCRHAIELIEMALAGDDNLASEVEKYLEEQAS